MIPTMATWIIIDGISRDEWSDECVPVIQYVSSHVTCSNCCVVVFVELFVVLFVVINLAFGLLSPFSLLFLSVLPPSFSRSPKKEPTK